MITRPVFLTEQEAKASPLWLQAKWRSAPEDAVEVVTEQIHRDKTKSAGRLTRDRAKVILHALGCLEAAGRPDA